MTLAAEKTVNPNKPKPTEIKSEQFTNKQGQAGVHFLFYKIIVCLLIGAFCPTNIQYHIRTVIQNEQDGW